MSIQLRVSFKNLVMTSLMAALTLSLLPGLMPFAAYSQEEQTGYSKEQIIEANFSGPVFLDSYWTSGSSSSESGTEVDIAPGDGTSTLAVVLINRGPSDIAGITGQLLLPDGFNAAGKAAKAPAVATFNQIAAVGNTFTLFFDVDVLDAARLGENVARLSLDYSRYFETGTPRTVAMDVPFRIAGEPIIVVSRTFVDDASGNSSQIAAGKIGDYTFSIANRGTAPTTNIVVSVESPLESLKILGDSKWTIQRIDENSQVVLATKVFAANSLIRNPAVIDVTVEYSSNGQSSSESFVLGTYVAGEISISIYDLDMNYIGEAPNLVGNLLNEGNTVALFTSIELMQSAAGESSGGTTQQQLRSSMAPQYLGDLSENSPLPFSVPLSLSPSMEPGSYPVTLKVTYKDELRNSHEFVTSGYVVLEPQQPADEGPRQGSLMAGLMLPLVVGSIAIAAVVVMIILRRRRSKRMAAQNNSAENEEDIENILSNPPPSTTEGHTIR